MNSYISEDSEVIDSGFCSNTQYHEIEQLYFFSFKPNKKFFISKIDNREDDTIIQYMFNDSYSSDKSLSSTNITLENLHINFLSSANKLIEIDNIVNKLKSSEINSTLINTITVSLLPMISTSFKSLSLAIQKRIVTSLVPEISYILILSKHTENIRDDIIPLLLNILVISNKEDNNIKELIVKSLFYIANNSKSDDISTAIITNIIELANDDLNYNNKILSIELFELFSSLISLEKIEMYIIPQILFLGEDSNYLIRKTVAVNIIKLSKKISQRLFNDLVFPIYLTLLKDSVWVVQKASADCIHEIVSFCDENNKVLLLKYFVLFCYKGDKYVRMSLLENIGEFIFRLNFKVEAIPNEVFKFYKDNMEFYLLEDNRDKDILFKCAFNFPAMLSKFGYEYWGNIKHLYFKLCKDKEFSIRKSLSASFNTVYSLLYESLVLVNTDDSILLENEMLLIFEYFFKDEKDIYFNLINSVDEFMLRLSCSNRHVILKKLISKINSSKFKLKDWRIQAAYANILGKICNYINIADVYDMLIPILLSFLLTDCSELRQVSAYNLGILIKLSSSLPNESNYYIISRDILEILALNENYTYRKLFCYALPSLYNSDLSYINELINLIENDLVINVRYALASNLPCYYKNLKLN